MLNHHSTHMQSSHGIKSNVFGNDSVLLNIDALNLDEELGADEIVRELATMDGSKDRACYILKDICVESNGSSEVSYVINASSVMECTKANKERSALEDHVSNRAKPSLVNDLITIYVYDEDDLEQFSSRNPGESGDLLVDSVDRIVMEVSGESSGHETLNCCNKQDRDQQNNDQLLRNILMRTNNNEKNSRVPEGHSRYSYRSEDTIEDKAMALARSSFVRHFRGDSASSAPISLAELVISSSGRMSLAGNASHRSDSSTSTRSFAFPILPSEWNSSPVKMAKPNRRRYRHERWRWCWRMRMSCCNPREA